MLLALTHHKLSPAVAGMEDVLTSAVFGALEALDAKDVLDVLGMSQALDGAMPLGALRNVRKASFTFWPWLGKRDLSGCEPDVLVDFTDQNGVLLARVLVEAKFRSGKSSYADEDGNENAEVPADEAVERRMVRDQLAREWFNFVSTTPAGVPALLVFLTAHWVCPVEDIREAQDELRRERHPAGNFAWLSWQRIQDWAHRNSGKSVAIQRLAEGLRVLGLADFHGVAKPTETTLQWDFAAHFRWAVNQSTPSWRFVQPLCARPLAGSVEWRFNSGDS